MQEHEKWLAIAKRDHQAALNLGQAGFYEQACFWLQQSVEKA
ncbi:MAG: HEPN domain-containing protein, partial [Candidatus Micrarchaeota archaeon]|nr:HEPN domain-containing protein [Candidatus Micrarchaeota archaeon]